MKFKNKTKWKDSDLRAMTRAAMEQAGISRPDQRFYDVSYRHGRQRGWVGGWAWYPDNKRNFREMRKFEITIPPSVNFASPIRVKELAHVILHEIAHTHGVKHREMAPWLMYGGSKDTEGHYDWALDYQIRLKESPAKPTREQVLEKRLALALGHKAEWERKFRYAKNKIRAWGLKARRLEKGIKAAKERGKNVD